MFGTLQGLSVIKSPQVLVQKGKHCIAFETTRQFASLQYPHGQRTCYLQQKTFGNTHNANRAP